MITTNKIKKLNSKMGSIVNPSQSMPVRCLLGPLYTVKTINGESDSNGVKV